MRNQFLAKPLDVNILCFQVVNEWIEHYSCLCAHTQIFQLFNVPGEEVKKKWKVELLQSIK